MNPYFGLIVFILIIPLIFAPIKEKKKREQNILLLSIVAIFLFMAFKAPSVGRDIAGYKRMYESMRYLPWSNFDIYWMEWGYELLMMIFTHIFHASFQVFMMCVYAFDYFSYYVFIKRYSDDYLTSALIYICFTFLNFDMSAVRTTIAVAICLFAIPYAEKKGSSNCLKFVLITLVAAQIHKSAYILVVVYFVIRIELTIKSSIFYLGIPAALFLFKSQFYGIINTYFKSVEESSVSLGGNLLVYIITIALAIFTWQYYKRYDKFNSKNAVSGGNISKEVGSYIKSSSLGVRMIYTGVVIQLFSSGTILSRMAQYFQIFIIILLPNIVNRIDPKSRVVIKFALYVLAIAYFVKFSLLDNMLDIVPYQVFWSEL